MCFKMVRTRQGTWTNSSLVQGSDQSSHFESDPDWDPLADTSSHVPAAPVHPEKGELKGLRDDLASHRVEASDRQG